MKWTELRPKESKVTHTGKGQNGAEQDRTKCRGAELNWNEVIAVEQFKGIAKDT